MDLDESLLGVLVALRLRKAQALLFFLLAEANRSHRTEKLLDLFWQEVPQEKAAVSLRQVVRQVRLGLSNLREVRLETGSSRLLLSAPPAFAVTNDLLSGLGQVGQWRRRADCLSGYLNFLENLVGLGPSFDSWLWITRSKLISGVHDRLDPVLSSPDTPPQEGRAIAEFALQIESSNEVAARFLMMQYWRGGKSTRAIEVYNRLYAYLGEEFDQEPEPETVSLLAAIKLEPGRVPDAVPPVLRPQIRIGMVLHADPTQLLEAEALSSVLHADLRMRMGRFREWRLVGDEVDVAPQVTLHLKPVLGPAKPGLFIELVSGRAGEMLWAERVDEPARDWEVKIRAVLINVANALSVVIADRALSDPAAGVYDRWLRSQVLLDTWSPETEGLALSMLQDITRDAPRFGPAHAELAGALNVRPVLLPGTRQTEDVKQVALHHAIEAVSIDPLDTRAHRVLAWCYCHMGEFELAEFHFDQAIALNPANAFTVVSGALGFAFSGNHVRALGLIDQTRRLGGAVEPFHLIYLAAADYLCGNYVETVQQCGAGSGLMTTAGGWHSAALWKLGREEEARKRLMDWMAEVRKLWRAEEPPTEQAILNWFAAIFPLRHASDREALRATLDEVARSAEMSL